MFDHDEARRLYSDGWTKSELARHCGVSPQSIRRVVDPICAAIYRQKQRGTCAECGLPCSVNTTLRATPRCRRCSDRAHATSVRPDALYCAGCDQWLPDEAFPKNRSGRRARRGRHSACRECNTARRCAYRVLHPEMEEAALARRRVQRRKVA